jgi:hypothetical protein
MSSRGILTNQNKDDHIIINITTWSSKTKESTFAA